MPKLLQLTGLHTLSLEKLKLTRIPQPVVWMTTLTCLVLSSNQLEVSGGLEAKGVFLLSGPLPRSSIPLSLICWVHFSSLSPSTSAERTVYTHAASSHSQVLSPSLTAYRLTMLPSADHIRSHMYFALASVVEDHSVAVTGCNMPGAFCPLASVQTIPSGPYLANLRCLGLASNHLPGIPAALSSAVCLEELDLSSNLSLSLQPAGLQVVNALGQLKRIKFSEDMWQRLEQSVSEDELVSALPGMKVEFDESWNWWRF